MDVAICGPTGRLDALHGAHVAGQPAATVASALAIFVDSHPDDASNADGNVSDDSGSEESCHQSPTSPRSADSSSGRIEALRLKFLASPFFKKNREMVAGKKVESVFERSHTAQGGDRRQRPWGHIAGTPRVCGRRAAEQRCAAADPPDTRCALGAKGRDTFGGGGRWIPPPPPLRSSGDGANRNSQNTRKRSGRPREHLYRLDLVLAR